MLVRWGADGWIGGGDGIDAELKAVVSRKLAPKLVFASKVRVFSCGGVGWVSRNVNAVLLVSVNSLSQLPEVELSPTLVYCGDGRRGEELSVRFAKREFIFARALSMSVALVIFAGLGLVGAEVAWPLFTFLRSSFALRGLF